MKRKMKNNKIYMNFLSVIYYCKQFYILLVNTKYSSPFLVMSCKINLISPKHFKINKK